MSSFVTKSGLILKNIGYPLATILETILNGADVAQIGRGIFGDFFATSANLSVILFSDNK